MPCHGNGIEWITLAAEHHSTLKECAVGGNQLGRSLRRRRHGVTQQRKDEEVSALGHAEEWGAESFAVERIDENRPLANVVHSQSGQRFGNQRLRIGSGNKGSSSVEGYWVV